MTAQSMPPPGASRTIYELSKEAHDGLHFSPRYALDTWRRSAEALIQKSDEHYRTGHVDLAFILMARAAVLLLEKIPQHPEYAHGLTDQHRHPLRKQGEECLSTLTAYKSLLYQDPPQIQSQPENQYQAGYPAVYPLEVPPLPLPPTVTPPSTSTASYTVPPSGYPPPVPLSLQPGQGNYRPTAAHQRSSHSTQLTNQTQAQGLHKPLIESCVQPAVRQLPSIPPQQQSDYHPRTSATGSEVEALERARRNRELEERDWEYACRVAEEQEREERARRGRGPGSDRNPIPGLGSGSSHVAGPGQTAGSGLEMPMQGLRVSDTQARGGLEGMRMPDPRDYRRRSDAGQTGYGFGYGAGPGPPVGGLGFGYSNDPGHGHTRHSSHPQTQSHLPPPVDAHRPYSFQPPPGPGRPISAIPDAPKSVVGSGRRRHLRPLQIPISLIPTFLRIAAPHTQRGIELCGLLLGVIRPLHRHRDSHPHSYTHHSGGPRRRGSDVSIAQSVLGHQEEEEGELEVRALLIPRQEGTSDTCTMKEEEKVIGVQLERGLIALGWIHTHPTQSCFMSSMDLHTHSAYQQTLPEAIAIVCAPRSEPSFGIFRLTEPAGLMTVLQCKRRQTFHEHPRIPGGLYTDADHGGHVLLNERGRGIEVIDLRR